MDEIYKLTKSKVRTHYIQNHWKIDWMLKRYKHLFKPNIYYADIGVGDGYTIDQVKPLVREVACVDRSTYLAMQTGAHQHFDMQVEYWKPKHTFSVITAFDVLEHTQDIGVALDHIRDALSGHLLITVPIDENLANRMTQCPICRHVFHSVGHNYSFTIQGWLDVITDHDLKIEDFGVVPFYFTKFTPLNWLLNVALDIIKPEAVTRTMFVYARRNLP